MMMLMTTFEQVIKLRSGSKDKLRKFLKLQTLLKEMKRLHELILGENEVASVEPKNIDSE